MVRPANPARVNWNHQQIDSILDSSLFTTQYSSSQANMNRPKLYQILGCILLLATCTACNSKMAKKEEAKDDQQVVNLSPTDKTLSLDEVELFLDVVKKDPNELPELIEVRYRNKSSQRSCLALPRPVVEDTDYELSRPCLCVATESLFLLTIPKGSPHESPTGVYLEPGEEVKRQYKLSSFCVIGHGIGPKPPANFPACYSAGKIEHSMQALIITDWNQFTRIASKDVTFNASEIDLTARFEIEE